MTKITHDVVPRVTEPADDAYDPHSLPVPNRCSEWELISAPIGKRSMLTKSIVVHVFHSSRSPPSTSLGLTTAGCLLMRPCEPTGESPSIRAGTHAFIETRCIWRILPILGLLSFVAVWTDAADIPYPRDVSSPLWSADQVAQWAVDHSPTARMLESERSAAATGIDRDDSKQCAQAGLKQSVLADLAQHERNRAAADVLEVYDRIVGLGRQRQLLVEAAAVIDRLIAMADQAELLGLSNEDPNDLRRKRLSTDDQILQVDSGVTKLRLRLAQLTGQSIEVTNQSILIDPLCVGQSIPAVDDAIAVALCQRSDLRALQTLTRCLNANTLPAGRELLAAQQPGLGLATQAVARLSLPCLSGPDLSTQDLRHRRHQCHELTQARADQIELEVRTGLVDLSTAQQRVHIADQRSQLASASIERRRASIDIDQAAPGSDLLVKLELLTARGEYVQHQIDEAVAMTRLRQAQGIAAEPMPDF